MLQLVLAILLVVQPAMMTVCAQLAAVPEECGSQCGDQNHSQTPQKGAPCCRFTPVKQDPQTIKTARVEQRAQDWHPAPVVADDAVSASLLRLVSRTEVSPTDLRHKRPLSEVLCVLLV